LAAVAQTLAQLPTAETRPTESQAVRVYRLAPEDEGAFTVGRDEDGVYRVRGRRVERLVAMTDLRSEEGVEHLQRQLARLGVFEALERAGVQVGDTVAVGDWETEWGV
jgi:GTP-binding protein